jgi:hypothetical protein
MDISIDYKRKRADHVPEPPDPDTKLAYNGVKVTKEALSVSTTSENHMPTLDHWHEKGGLVARGVLIDYKDWYEQRAVAEGKSGAEATYNPVGGYRITVADIEAVAKDQNLEFRAGDVLIVRTGMTEVLEAPTPADFAMMQNLQFSGVDGSVAMARWLWNRHFAAVASDSIAFEALPPLDESGEPASMEKLGECISTMRYWSPCIAYDLQSCTPGCSPCSACLLANCGILKPCQHIARR